MEFMIQTMQFVALVTLVVSVPGIVSALNDIARSIRETKK